ncbi:MAG TPA: 50S ribosomal protein L11 methyltransferase [Gemmatimonadaceae bacterium]
MSWLSLRARAGGCRDAALAALFAAGSQGVHEDGDALVTHFPDGSSAEAARRAVLGACPGAEVELTPLPDVDWTESWKKGVRAHRLGALTVAPPWLAGEHDAATTIVIEPAMGFGTGEHATTRGVVRLMQGVVRAGDDVADLGAGSAVLSIAAAKLGAARVAAIEMDPEAIGNAEENVARNAAGGRVRVLEGDAAVLLPLVAPVRVVLANIISSVLVELLPVIERALAPGGEAILSGILGTERDAMLGVLGERGWLAVAEDHEDAWWSVHVVRASGADGR